MAELKTPFWRKASRNLPAPVRERYAGYLVQAERWDLALDAVSEFFSAKGARGTRHA